mgnify:CR=1 FL=1
MPSKAAKTPTKKTARKASTSTASSAAKRTTVATLAQNLKSLETRLKGADTKNRNAIKALETLVSDIKNSAKQSTTTQKAALTRGLNTLEIRMETYLERAAADARAGVRSELASVTASGADIGTLETAVQAAHNRLDQMDATQRDSLARLNRHIAGLATSVEQRLTSETKARLATAAALDAKIDSVSDHVDRVEIDTATALEAVGAKVAEFAAVLEKRAQSSDADTAERLADLAQETQAEFNVAQSDVTARLEALEVIASAWSPTETTSQAMANPYLPANEDDPRIDQMGEMIRSLQDELSRMHARIATVQNGGSPLAAVPTNIVPLTTAMNPGQIQGQVQDNPYAAAAQALERSAIDTPAPIAQTPPPVQPTPVQPTPVQPTPVQPTPVQSNPVTPPKQTASHIPQEYDPSAFAPKMESFETFHGGTQPQAIPLPNAPLPTTSSQDTITAPITPPLPTPPMPPAPLPPMAPPMASSGSHAPLPTRTNAPAAEPLMPAPLPVSTYADPAYAEGDDMRAERIGGNSGKKSGPKLPISGRNLRVGALAVGVAVTGLFAAKTILGGPETGGLDLNATEVSLDAPNMTPDRITPQSANISDADFPAINTQPAPNAPVGQYAETQPPAFVAGQENTLDAAVAAGNPIAQFQKGLAQLQAGQMEEGARLIRLAANRNQPAAQYRLAKLYETGTGVAKDPITARELVERAARGGNRIAMHDLGNYHAYGQGGLTKNMTEALNWFSKAAERGVVDSQFNVAFLREGNEGVAADVEASLFWYHIAARQGDQGAPDRIAILNEQVDAATQADILARANQFTPKPVDEAANGVFRNVAWAKPATAPRVSKSAEILKIRDAQTLLTELGYEVGAADGIAGSKTTDAVKSFEAVNGLPQTGKVTDALIEKLEIATGT